ncbi:MAG: hypothetical protein IVW51_03005 [Thermaceae bacterium]|nr:hypothetical protein [Thermaceae bacterium]
MKTYPLYTVNLSVLRFFFLALLLVLAACGSTQSTSQASPAYTLSLGSASVSLLPGNTASLPVTVTPDWNSTTYGSDHADSVLNRSISLSVVDSNGNPVTGVTVSPASLSVSGNSPITQTFTLNVVSTIAAGKYSLFLKNTLGALSQKTPFTLIVTAPAPAADFTLAALNPASLTIAPGATGTTQASLTPLNGFTGSANLTLASVVDSKNNPTSGITLASSPVAINISGTSPVNQNLTLNIASSVSTGSYTLTLQAASSSINKTTTLALTVSNKPDFNLGLNPASLTLASNSNATTQATLTPANGFTGMVNVTLASVVDSKNNPISGITLASSPVAVSLSSTPAINQNLTINVGSVADGVYTLTLQAASGSISKTATLSLSVSTPTFTLAALNPASLPVLQGNSGTTQSSLTPLNGFTGSVSLSLVDSGGNPVSGITVSPSSLSLSGSAVNQSLTVSVTSGVATNTYPLTLKATSGSIIQTTPLSLKIIALPIVSLSASSTNVASPGSITLTATPASSVGIAKVEFYEGTTLLGTATTSPYTQSLSYTSTNNGPHTYTAKAYDTLNNSSTSSPVSVSVSIAVSVLKVSAGDLQNCALGSDSKAYCWGYNGSGGLGNGSTTNSNTPVAVTMPSSVTFTQIAAGSGYICALGSDSKAYCWGTNSYGQLGIGSTSNKSTPTAVTMPSGVTFNQLASGISFTCALGSDSKAYCWGNNTSGQLGNSSTTQSNVPSAVTMPTGVTFSQIGAGGYHTCALGSDSKAYCWGWDNVGQLGNGVNGISANSTTPVAVTMPRGVIFSQITGGYAHTCALGSDNNTYCWGNDDFGQLGIGSTSNTNTPTALILPTGVIFSQISAGSDQTCAVASGGKGYCWGRNDSGQLGNGSTTQSNVPAAVTMPTGVTFSQIAASDSTCAVSSDGKAYCWGWGSYGQLGNGTPTNSSTPVLVNPLP